MAISLIGEAAEGGAELIVFPECFVALYPTWVWAGTTKARRFAGMSFDHRLNDGASSRNLVVAS